MQLLRCLKHPTRFQKQNTLEKWNSLPKFHENHTADNEWNVLKTTSAWQLNKVKSKKEVIHEAHKDKRKVHFATLMGIKIRDVLRGDSVKDDVGAYAVFIEQGSSASQMNAAK